MNDFARRMALMGIRFPISGTMSNDRVLIDADNHTFAMVMPDRSATLECDRAHALIDALNALAGFETKREAA